jgi:hypothetical protein
MNNSSNIFRSIIAAAMVFTVSATTTQALNILSDPGFEAGSPPADGNTFDGWSIWSSVFTFSQDYARSGLWSMKCAAGPDPFFFGGCLEFTAAVPGTSYNLSGWGFSPTPLTSFGRGLLEITFLDSSFISVGTVETGPPNPPYSVFQDSPAIDGSMPADTWTPLSETATAPANAAYAWVGILASTYPEPDAIYFDDLSLSPIPEPSSLVILGLGALAFVVSRRRT